MKTLSLTSSLVAVLTFSAFAQSNTTLRSQISVKEKELIEIQKELASLRNRLGSKTTASTAKRYTVAAGDTVSSIARRHKVSAKQVMSWNKITDPTKLKIGQSLVIGSSATAKPGQKVSKIETIVEKPATAPKAKDYIVQRGDTFYSIARRHKITVTQLRALNPDVSTHRISSGQTLCVTGKPTAEQIAKVKADRKAAITAKNKAAKAKATAAKKAAAEKKAALAKKAKEAAEAKKAASIANLATTSTVKEAKPQEQKATTVLEKKVEKKEVAIAAVSSTPPSPPVIKERPPVNSLATASKPKTVSAVILTTETTFDEFADKHGTSTEQLNALNGWNLPKTTVLARGSEIYVPQ